MQLSSYAPMVRGVCCYIVRIDTPLTMILRHIPDW